MWGGGVPDVEEVRLRPARGVLAWLSGPELLQPRIDIQGDGIDILGCCSQLLHVAGIIPGIEHLFRQPGVFFLPRHVRHQVRVVSIHFLGRLAFAEHLFPRALHLLPVGIPHAVNGRL